MDKITPNLWFDGNTGDAAPDRAAAERVMMLMVKLDVAAPEAAFNGK